MEERRKAAPFHSLNKEADVSAPQVAWTQRIIEGSLLGYVLFAPWSIAGAQTCLGLGLAAWVVNLIANRGHGLKGTPLALPILVFLGLKLASALFSPDHLKGLRALGAEWIVLLFFLVANRVRREETVRRILDLLVAVTVLIGLYAIWQHFAGWDLYRDRPLHPTGNVFEATGLFSHHLTYGGFVMCVLLFSGCLFLWGSRGRRRVAYGLASLILSLALFWSYARSAWVGLIVGILAIGLLRGRKILILGLVGMILVIGLLFLLQPSLRLQTREVVEVLGDPMRQSHRLQMWSTSLKMIRDRPFFGVGLGQVKSSLLAYGCDLGYGHVHNDFLNTAANTGLLGLVAFIWIWVTFLRMIIRCRPRQQNHGLWSAVSTAGFGLMIAFLAAGLFQCYYTDEENAMLLWFLLGLVTAVCRMEGLFGGATWKLARATKGEPDE